MKDADAGILYVNADMIQRHGQARCREIAVEQGASTMRALPVLLTTCPIPSCKLTRRRLLIEATCSAISDDPALQGALRSEPRYDGVLSPSVSPDGRFSDGSGGDLLEAEDGLALSFARSPCGCGDRCAVGRQVLKRLRIISASRVAQMRSTMIELRCSWVLQ